MTSEKGDGENSVVPGVMIFHQTRQDLHKTCWLGGDGGIRTLDPVFDQMLP
jgi:hypothetical protein